MVRLVCENVGKVVPRKFGGWGGAPKFSGGPWCLAGAPLKFSGVSPLAVRWISPRTFGGGALQFSEWVPPGSLANGCMVKVGLVFTWQGWCMKKSAGSSCENLVGAPVVLVDVPPKVRWVTTLITP